jgi:hypothetical protein
VTYNTKEVRKMLKPTKAGKDEICTVCGYPFDDGDDCYQDKATEKIYCTNTCYEDEKDEKEATGKE